MDLFNQNAQVMVPDHAEPKEALARTTMLCIAAHQDDTEIMAYHAIGECYGKEDEWFTSVIATDGAGSPRSGLYSEYTNEQMRLLRMREQNNAAIVGGYSMQIQLGYTSGQVKDPEQHDLTGDIIKILLVCKPKIVLTHNLADRHETHVSTALRTIFALRNIPDDVKPEKVYAMEVWRSLDWLNDEDKLIFDTAMHPNIANAVLGVFDSQICGGKRYDLAAIGRRRANATFLASHGVDRVEEAAYGMDITELMASDADPGEFISRRIDAFKNNVLSKIKNHW